MKEPIFNLTPEELEIADAIKQDENIYQEAFLAEIEQAKAEVAAGHTYTHDEVVAMLGL